MNAGEALLASDPWGEVARLDDTPSYATAWLSLAVQGLGGEEMVREAVLVLGAANVGPFHAKALWPHGQVCSPELSAACERVLAVRLPVSQRTPSASAIQALPVMVGNALIGVVGVRYRQSQVPGTSADWLRWGAGWLAARHASSDSEDSGALRERLMVGLDLMALALGEATLDSACQAVVTEAAQRLGADRVALGFVQGSRGVRVSALSHTADVSRRQDLTLAIEAAMTEAADQGRPIAWVDDPDEPVAPDLVRREHQRLTREFGNWRVLTIPFSVSVENEDEREHGVFMFEWSSERDATEQEEALAATLPSIVGHALIMKRRQDRGWLDMLADSVKREAKRMVGPRHTKRKLLGLALLSVLAFCVFATGDFRVSADARLEGRVRRMISAPFDGFVASAQARAGQVVKQGELLATLDDRELQLEASRWSSQESQYTRQANDAEAQRNLAQIQIAKAQSDQAYAQRQLSESLMDKARVIAPFAGLIVSGDLSQQLGGAVKKGQQLFEIAPLDAWRIVLEVPESDIGHVRVGQRGKLVLTAMPDKVLDFEVTLVTAVAHAEQGKNFFRVEAKPRSNLPDLRPGMLGLGKVTVGEARLIWIWTRHFTDWMRLQAWSWLGV